MALLEWIWGLLKKLFDCVKWIVSLLANVVTSVVGWVVGFIAWVLIEVFDWVGGAINNLFASMFDAMSSLDAGSLQVQPLADWLLNDLLALDVAWTLFFAYWAFYLFSRLSRTSMTIIKAFLEIV